MLAICRGMQVLNVAHGGTLIEDIADRHPEALPHRVEGGEAYQGIQDVTVVAGFHHRRSAGYHLPTGQLGASPGSRHIWHRSSG